jgi:hypothetical protein
MQTHRPIFCFVVALLSASIVDTHAASYAFGTALNTPVAIPEAGGITYTTTIITGGTGSPGTAHGTVTNQIGGTFTGSVFSNQMEASPSLTTNMSTGTRGSIENQGDTSLPNWVGLRVSFSAPIAMFSFGILDMDGLVGTTAEWSTSIAFNDTDAILPTISLNQVTFLTIAQANTTGSNFPANTPVDLPFVNKTVDSDPPATSPDLHEAQAMFSYGGVLVTDLYFMWGIFGDPSDAGEVNSGITAFSVVDPVPEPSSVLLLALGSLAFMARRNRG